MATSGRGLTGTGNGHDVLGEGEVMWSEVDDAIRHLRSGEIDAKDLRDAFEQIKENVKELESILDTKADAE